MAATTSDEAKAKNVLRQVEFYFSDSNLPRDKFLMRTVQESEDGLVSLALVCSFSRMKSHLGLDATMKPEEIPEERLLAVADVLRRSSSLRVSDDGKRVGRSTDLMKPEEVIEHVDSRTIAASPLPYDIKLEDAESFFSHHGKINSVRLPRHVSDKRHFCGTALIEFSEETDANKVLEEKLVFAGAVLELKPKKHFDSERERKREEADKSHFNKNALDGSYPKGLIVAFKLKKKQADESMETNASDKVNDRGGGFQEEEVLNTGSEKSEKKTVEDVGKSPINVNTENEAKDADKLPKESEEDVADDDFPDNEVTREDLKQVFQKFGAVKYTDYRMGEESGYVRFEDPEAATKARAAAALVDEGGLIVKNYIATLEALTGEAEKEYWNQLRGNQEKHRESKGNRGRGGKYNRGGRVHYGKHSRQTDSAERQPSKAQKVEATA